ncbi:glutaminyl-peptide cyclotransferase-like protein [Bisporella sp. PMI_857]|nr:glutaminyl-peptide cyclotransferase-like protein [Bisporella sp. PMI_857]
MATRVFQALLLVFSTFSLHVLALTPLSDETLKNLPSAGADFDIKTGGILSPILVPRVPGTPGNLGVQKHFKDWFTTHLPKWTIEYQNSTSTTPATGDKQVPFTNIIITRDPPWSKPGDVGRLALVAHFDSKLSPAGFIGATDSAAPCAMIMHAARSVDEALTRKWAAMEADGSGGSGLEDEKGVQILLLDGEEAFVSWTDTDSLYGARSLAETWESTPHVALSTHKNALNSITLFLLLDLLGAAGPKIPSYFQTTHWAYRALSEVESRLRALGSLQSKTDHPFLPDNSEDKKFFQGGWGVQDDHIPFMARGVEVLHIIPTPFPTVWHRLEDDGEHLDLPTVEDWAKIVTAFVGEWMDLEGYFPPKTEGKSTIRENIAKDELDI